ncbi:hypothetical protein JZ751_003864 [Albula glossodonta]|uniref:Uncharacterized protein n=1 Tax=Albula glossodonta TaxID=121402 RepID=A0A8T2PEC9_9TELE|nr:hypothetical protein JZ751_003864 [Albula glossodonta]
MVKVDSIQTQVLGRLNSISAYWTSSSWLSKTSVVSLVFVAVLVFNYMECDSPDFLRLTKTRTKSKRSTQSQGYTASTQHSKQSNDPKPNPY